MFLIIMTYFEFLYGIDKSLLTTVRQSGINKSIPKDNFRVISSASCIAVKRSYHHAKIQSFRKHKRDRGAKRELPVIVKKFSEIHTVENLRAEDCDFEINGWS